MTKRVHGRCENEMFLLWKKCNLRTCRVDIIRTIMLRSGEIWTSMLFFRKEIMGNLSYLNPFTRKLWTDDSFVASYSIKNVNFNHRFISGCSGWIPPMSQPFYAAQITEFDFRASEGSSFWSQAFLNYNLNGVKVAKFRTPCHWNQGTVIRNFIDVSDLPIIDPPNCITSYYIHKLKKHACFLFFRFKTQWSCA